MTTDKQQWESVLAQVEEDVRRTEALLVGTSQPGGPGRHRSTAPTPMAPAETMLPSPGPGPELPPLSTMPSIPPELLDRIVTLRARIEALHGEIETAMAQWRASTQLAESGRPQLRVMAMAPAAAPRFVDRQL